MPPRLALLIACVALATPSPLAASELALLALTDDGALVRFTTSRPGQVRRLPVQGATGTLVGIDRRSRNDRVYAVTTTSDLYAIDPDTGGATSVATLTIAFDAGPLSAFDFNPQSDRLRLIGINGQNLRVHTEIGAAATDAPLAFARGDRHFGTRPAITAAAYTDAVAETATTRLFDLDTTLDVLALQDPPNDGVLTTVGPLGIDFEPAAGFDVFTDDRGVDHALAVSRSALHAIDLTTGQATALGTVGDGTLRLIGFTILGPVDAPPTTTSAPER